MANRKKFKKSKLRNAEYYNMQDSLDKLYQNSLLGYKFYNLIKLIESKENIMMAYRNLKSNTGSKTPGIDKQTIQHLQKWEVEKLIKHVQKKLNYYQPNKVKRVLIPKDNGKTRPLGIPTIMDRLIQQAIYQIMEPICEAKFHKRSNGFRPNRSAENALAQCYRLMQIQNLHYVVDMDIKSFFDNVNHGKVIKQLWSLGIRDKKLLKIISIMMKAEIANIGFPEKGTPQGGIISPLISNIVLNELDWWISSQWETMKTKHDYVSGASYLALKKTKLKECYIVRYADDFKIFCKNKQHAFKLYYATKLWLKDRLDLDISDEKSKVINLKKEYSDFLGFKMKVIMKSKKYVVSSFLNDKSKRKINSKLLEQIKKIQCPKNAKEENYEVDIFNSQVVGMHEYYSFATNSNLDFQKIAFLVSRSLNYRLRERIKTTTSKPQRGYVYERYKSSKQIRFISDRPLAPIGYVQKRNPMYKANKVNKYTIEGRELIHKKLCNVDMNTLHYMMENPISARSIEYNDNRLALYCANKGNCYVTGAKLVIGRIHCHHKVPLNCGGDDTYSNLVIMDIDVHMLIHAKTGITVRKYYDYINPNYYHRDKINRYRKLLNLEPLEYYLG